MNLLKIGDRWINFDQVTDVEECGAGLNVTLTSLELEECFGPASRVLVFTGGEADALRRRLDDEALDLTPSTADGRAFAVYRGRGGSLTLAAWKEKHDLLRQMIANDRRRDLEPAFNDQINDLELELLL